jgi:hypothetical protein
MQDDVWEAFLGTLAAPPEPTARDCRCVVCSAPSDRRCRRCRLTDYCSGPAALAPPDHTHTVLAERRLVPIETWFCSARWQTSARGRTGKAGTSFRARRTLTLRGPRARLPRLRAHVSARNPSPLTPRHACPRPSPCLHLARRTARRLSTSPILGRRHKQAWVRDGCPGSALCAEEVSLRVKRACMQQF